MKYNYSKEERQKKIKELAIKNKKNIKPEYNCLFNECLQSLGYGVRVLSHNQSQQVYTDLQEDFPFTCWGRIDWEKVKNKTMVEDVNYIIEYINSKINKENILASVLWSYGDEPVIETNLEKVIDEIENINSIGCDQWIYSKLHRFVIEFYHDGEIIIGFADNSDNLMMI